MNDEQLANARILVVDDQEANARILERILRQNGFNNVKSITDSRLVEPAFPIFRPDMILLDIMMPHLDGFGVMERLRPLIEGTYFPILVVTADINRETKRKALEAGAKDFLSKPIDTAEIVLRIKNLLMTRFLHLRLIEQNHSLEQRVNDRTEELEVAHIEVMDRLARAAEFRDDETGEHTIRVGRLSQHLALQLGLTKTEALLIFRAAPLHDLGKIGIPDTILLKPGVLTGEEMTVMRTHATIGAQILSGGRFPLLRMAETIALSHHERWDGGGYPHGLRGEEIPLCGRIVAVADVFDALRHTRPYKGPWPLSETMEEIQRNSGTQFDPQVVTAFMKVLLNSGLV